MPKNDLDKPRRKIVVEEVGDLSSTVEITPQASEEVVQEVVSEPQITEVAAETVSEPVVVETQPEVKPEPIPQPVYEEVRPQLQSGPSPLVVIVPGIFLLGALLGGIIFYQKSLDKTQSATPVPTETAVETPVATDAPVLTSVDVTKYSVKILNGSGIKGEASKVQDLIEKDGFKVSTTGNADNYDYTKTVIQAKADADKDFIAKLSETLGKTYSVDTKTQSLSSTSKDEIVVIVGTSKK